MKRKLGIVLLVVSLVFLALGLYFPFMTIKIQVDMGNEGGFLGNLIGGSIADQFNKTTRYNIPQAMQMLFENEQYFVGTLIGLFAVFLPITKTIISVIYLRSNSKKLYNFMNLVGKFAMADVFCVGVFVAFLYSKFNQTLKADIEIGYYYFTIYVILNIISLLLLQPSNQKE